MSQNFLGNTITDPTNGATLIGLLLAWQGALHSLHKGADRPSYAQAGTAWLKEVSSSDWRLMIYDGTDTDIQIGIMNPAANTWTPSIASGAITTAMLAAQAVDGTKFARGTAGHVWTAAGGGTDPGWSPIPSTTDRVAKAGDTMTGDLTMTAGGKLKASGTTAATTNIVLAGGADLGGLFMRGLSFSSTGSGPAVSGYSFSFAAGILTIVESRYDPAGGGGGGGGG